MTYSNIHRNINTVFHSCLVLIEVELCASGVSLDPKHSDFTTHTSVPITVKEMHDSHASGVFLSMYWLKSRRNCVLLSDSFSSLQYSLKKQYWSDSVEAWQVSSYPVYWVGRSRDHSPRGNEGVTELIEPLHLYGVHGFWKHKITVIIQVYTLK